MKTMKNRTASIQIMHSMKFLSAAFTHGANAAARGEEMREVLYRDTELLQNVIEICGFNAPSDSQKAFMLERMSRPDFMEMVDRINHLTSPEMYTPLSRKVPNIAQGYWELKGSLGNLQAAVMPVRGVYDEPALTA